MSRHLPAHYVAPAFLPDGTETTVDVEHDEDGFAYWTVDADPPAGHEWVLDFVDEFGVFNFDVEPA